MALIDRIFHTDSDENRHISNHAWASALWFFSKGQVNRTQIVNAFNLTVDDQIQLDQLIAHFQGLTVEEKSEFHSNLESAGTLAEEGLISQTLYRSFLGLT